MDKIQIISTGNSRPQHFLLTAENLNRVIRKGIESGVPGTLVIERSNYYDTIPDSVDSDHLQRSTVSLVHVI